MPSASYSPRRRVSDIESAIEVLRAEGHRVSATRRLVLEGLFAADGPVSAERLTSGIPAADLASVYRNLELLERLGLVSHVHIGHGPGLYALTGEEEHCYVVCERCDRLERLPAEEVEPIRERVRRAMGFEAHFTHFPILGLCADCAASPEGAEGVEGVEPAAPRREGEHSHGDRVHTHSHSHPGHEH